MKRAPRDGVREPLCYDFGGTVVPLLCGGFMRIGSRSRLVEHSSSGG
jgi:hypothetical protein